MYNMGNKDKINKISGIAAIIMFVIVIYGDIAEGNSLLGFPNIMLLYLLMPLGLVWFGTRKNGCGSCNQTCSISETKEDKDIKK